MFRKWKRRASDLSRLAFFSIRPLRPIQAAVNGSSLFVPEEVSLDGCRTAHASKATRVMSRSGSYQSSCCHESCTCFYVNRSFRFSGEVSSSAIIRLDKYISSFLKKLLKLQAKKTQAGKFDGASWPVGGAAVSPEQTQLIGLRPWHPSHGPSKEKSTCRTSSKSKTFVLHTETSFRE